MQDLQEYYDLLYKVSALLSFFYYSDEMKFRRKGIVCGQDLMQAY